ncbi:MULTISPECIES: GntR family transcriptional regulator [unclassified Saccharopolyspora]|uniref:GntR family transcriptional regulator n=1 Tax=unclassified Saccharopolyspora TaxID=2646250 RepID=UPI001CD5FBFB|nr:MULTISPECIES: GntR family transcriptional regulator [unclassified Saccharopolyspora]MCA1190477.1 GntR family transcriptional regulator [Saccharopolyspora sp. 6T]MCA1279642.1 GntR family transcriptional regulator [Saccharopolyspora sp. 7B]
MADAVNGRTPLREQVRRALQDRISDGRLRPGDRLYEQEIAAEFGVSRVPVREAIRMLQSEGLVDVAPNRRGVFVRSLDRAQVEELFDVREALEALAARLAASRASADVADRLGVLAERARRAWAGGDVDAMSAANTEFHDRIVALSGNALLASVLEPLHGRLAWLFRLNLEPERVCREHDELHAAIAGGDGDRAAELALGHVRASRTMVLDKMLF